MFAGLKWTIPWENAIFYRSTWGPCVVLTERNNRGVYIAREWKKTLLLAFYGIFVHSRERDAGGWLNRNVVKRYCVTFLWILPEKTVLAITKTRERYEIHPCNIVNLTLGECAETSAPIFMGSTLVCGTKLVPPLMLKNRLGPFFRNYPRAKSQPGFLAIYFISIFRSLFRNFAVLARTGKLNSTAFSKPTAAISSGPKRCEIVEKFPRVMKVPSTNFLSFDHGVWNKLRLLRFGTK